MTDQESSTSVHERIAESAIAKRVHQAIPYLLAIISVLLMRSLNGIEASQEKGSAIQAHQSEQLATMSTDVKVLSTKVDLSVLDQITDIKKRLDRLEQVTKTP